MTGTLAPAARLGSAPLTALCRYYDRLQTLAAEIAASRPASDAFVPSFVLPDLDDGLREYLDVGQVAVQPLAPVADKDVWLLDLMRNPATRTTKTMASLLMVVRAVAHVRATGESVTMLTPSSANKATALRHAVLRAIECGLVTADQLNIAVVAPEPSRGKIWASALDTDPALAARNPVMLLPGTARDGVKQVAAAATDVADELRRSTGRRLWYTLDLDNYRLADAARALVEAELLPAGAGRSRAHVHAVSSAYGLLGHHLGRERLAPQLPAPQYFLVQHLDTPDMVLSLYFGAPDRSHLPDYRWDAVAGLYRQEALPQFPRAVADPGEVVDPTFYTHAPPTSVAMNEIIARNGGGGIVVSLHECLELYPRLRSLLAGAGIELPGDPRDLREWSLVMAGTGMLLAVERGLLTADQIVLHASGSYSTHDFDPVANAHVIATSTDVRELVLRAAGH